MELFGLSGIQHTPISIKNARVSQVRPFPAPRGAFSLGWYLREAGLAPHPCQAAPPCGPGVDANTGNDVSVLAALQSQPDCNLQPVPGEWDLCPLSIWGVRQHRAALGE